ncbi:Hypothetical protein AA314_05103 [Archangium gephyra]|uniref:Uncharacterized protein n=1 Tax=Archangium gephyra TaxID=48 RepID=A0AAC8TEZ4_9BACT|nr:Hypothetical protein AA314_05103 [Archangium gephyra]
MVSKEPKKERMPREDWAKLLRRTFASGGEQQQAQQQAEASSHASFRSRKGSAP